MDVEDNVPKAVVMGTTATSFSHEEPRTVGDESLEEWAGTVAGLEDWVTGGPRSSRIPVLWAGETTQRRRKNSVRLACAKLKNLPL
jgi:hypothetical protein